MTGPTLTYHHRFFDPEAFVKSYIPTVPGRGLFLRTDKPFALWTRFELAFYLPNDEQKVVCLVEVIWVNRGHPQLTDGMGVRFVNLSQADRTRVEEFLRTWARREELFDGRYFRFFPLDDRVDQTRLKE